MLRRLDRAIADFSQATAAAPKYAAAYDGRGTAYADQGNFDQAIADYTQAAALERAYDVEAPCAVLIAQRALGFKEFK